MNSILEVEALRVRFGSAAEPVRGVSLRLDRGETHCLVGESGCGKSLTALSIMNLLPRGATRSAETLHFDGRDLLSLSPRRMARLSGDRLAMIFQEPMTSLNPAYTIGSQMTEVLRRHRGLPRGVARVGVSPPEHRLAQYPHQLSGGLRQRVMIAMALLCEPALLIADEPTTALDVTVQAQMLRLLAGLRRELGLAVLLITHDLGVVARVADHVSVMYAGEIVESAPAASLFAAPTHPYTKGLLAAVPVPGKVRRGAPLGAIPGIVPSLAPGFVGCAFRDRCAEAIPACAAPIARQRITEGSDARHDWLCRLSFGWAPRKAA
jgi:peptide/nickel transport system ATP-binding protein